LPVTALNSHGPKNAPRMNEMMIWPHLTMSYLRDAPMCADALTLKLTKTKNASAASTSTLAAVDASHRSGDWRPCGSPGVLEPFTTTS